MQISGATFTLSADSEGICDKDSQRSPACIAVQMMRVRRPDSCSIVLIVLCVEQFIIFCLFCNVRAAHAAVSHPYS